ncbi:tRNA/rRNA methyltransferase [Mycoplasmopsis canis UF31]|uniref:rRNA methylase n=1 Tax=Mycoplasmopsis canis TaxID=29555 RepID=A0A0F6ZM57_9BACT|nr:23S rRNA (guanosine(2251)-2'-O)-methyltransferase RlmB [Mycoplasmopsis canis]AKF41511.1 rRNA methyltransferase [Mycoplasmopsis canis]AMD81307.1 rRNA methyltransferase [Mycoplasmopsis canis PG 14]EIE40409.1 tRNA/rRNA methyltransferase [Mycoplasmopsis canis UF31]EIE40550.1 tRNA/rRNA methyltransferase [Mycoplasmopsis canis PG 14]EIE40693.1 tRNA/rRNA methyltransferase [Mycoplasmopsis canis UF33]
MRELIVCGKNSVLDAVKNNLGVKKIIISNKENIKLFDNSRLQIEIQDVSFLNKLTKENHQGFIAIMNDIVYRDIEYLIKNKPEIVLMLDKIQDPHNLGAIIRTANATGVTNIVLPKENSASINATSLKVSSGGFVGINFYRVNSLSATITKLKKAGYWSYATALDKEAVSLAHVNYNKPSIIVVGNEGDGVSKSVLSVCDSKIYIPQKGTVQSMNVSVATGIVLFDFLRKNEE